MPYRIVNRVNGWYIPSSTSSKVDPTNPVYAKVYATLGSAKQACNRYQKSNQYHYDTMVKLKAMGRWDNLYGTGVSPGEKFESDYQIEEL